MEKTFLDIVTDYNFVVNKIQNNTNISDIGKNILANWLQKHQLIISEMTHDIKNLPLENDVVNDMSTSLILFRRKSLSALSNHLKSKNINIKEHEIIINLIKDHDNLFIDLTKSYLSILQKELTYAHHATKTIKAYSKCDNHWRNA